MIGSMSDDDAGWPSDRPVITGDEAVASAIFAVNAAHLRRTIGEEPGDELLNIDGMPAIRRANGQLLKYQWKPLMPSLSMASHAISKDGGKTWEPT